ncbi:MAG: hypothetical protein AAF560_08740 [Acidobacteriota bacterium]
MLLPGGLCEHGERLRRFAFKPPTGAIELAMMRHDHDSLPQRVTQVLCEALEHVGDLSPDADRLQGLCVGDRQFLIRRLAIHFGWDGGWRTVACGHCESEFDLFIETSALPVKEAGEGFPFAEANLEGRSVRLRVPNGADQQRIAGIESDDEALRALLELCLVTPSDLSVAELPKSAVERLEQELEAVAPEVVTQVESACPDCGRANAIAVDPYACLQGDGGELLAEVHALAMSYHWSEPQILALPRDRRLHYLELVDRSRGMTH